MDSINILEILSEPHELTKAKFKFNGVLYENVKWEISGNILYFEGDRIDYEREWDYLTNQKVLDKIESKFIKVYYYCDGFVWKLLSTITIGVVPIIYGRPEEDKNKFPNWLLNLVKVKIMAAVHGNYIYKKRVFKFIKTNVWSVIDYTKEGGSNGRINSKEQDV